MIAIVITFLRERTIAITVVGKVTIVRAITFLIVANPTLLPRYLHLNSYSGDLLKMTFLGQPAKSNLTIRLWKTFI